MPIDFQDYATEADELADMLADNRLSELAELDEDRLATVLRDLECAGHDVQFAGFTPNKVVKHLVGEVETDSVESIP